MQDNRSSGVGVLDKAAHILDCLEAGPATLSQLVEATGLARPRPTDWLLPSPTIAS